MLPRSAEGIPCARRCAGHGPREAFLRGAGGGGEVRGGAPICSRVSEQESLRWTCLGAEASAAEGGKGIAFLLPSFVEMGTRDVSVIRQELNVALDVRHSLPPPSCCPGSCPLLGPSHHSERTLQSPLPPALTIISAQNHTLLCTGASLGGCSIVSPRDTVEA